MASQSQGIHQLLQAEKRAKDKLEEAKKRKVKRLKQAKEEAMAEIDQYRMEKDKEFRLKQSKLNHTIINPGQVGGHPGQGMNQIMGSQSNLSEEIEEQTRGKIKELNGSYNKSMEEVMKQLLNIVCDVKPEIHLNYRAAD